MNEHLLGAAVYLLGVVLVVVWWILSGRPYRRGHDRR